MGAREAALDGARLRRSLGRGFEDAYARGGERFVRRALVAQLAVGFVVGLVGALLTLLYADLSWADLAIVIALSWLIYAVDAALALEPIRRGLVPFEHWWRVRDESSARAAWEGLADLPFAVLRRRVSYAAALALIVVWDVVGVRRLGLSPLSFLLFFPGSVLVWLYWLALRFFVMEQLLRPVLADVGRNLPDGGGVHRPRITLARRLLVAVPAITIIGGTVVA